MFWMIPVIAVGGALKLIYDASSSRERKARRRWERKRREVKRSVEEHRRNIENHIEQAQSSYNFHLLIDLHYSSVSTGNAAYRLLQDARSTITGMNRMLYESLKQRKALRTNFAKARSNRDRDEIHEIGEQLEMVRDLRKNLFSDRLKVSGQAEELLAEVRRLNSRTRTLKEYIRDRCGRGGIRWYERLEYRANLKRLAS